jgi:hypothetical protein
MIFALGSSPTFSSLSIIAALLSWTLAEVLMAPVLKPLFGVLWLTYTVAAFVFVAWFYRVGRLVPSDWQSYMSGLAPAAWSVEPAHALLPTALLLNGSSSAGAFLVYELVKISLILIILQRTFESLQRLTTWPRWGALLLMVSPVVVTLVSLSFIFLIFGIAALAMVIGELA